MVRVSLHGEMTDFTEHTRDRHLQFELEFGAYFALAEDH